MYDILQPKIGHRDIVWGQSSHFGTKLPAQGLLCIAIRKDGNEALTMVGPMSGNKHTRRAKIGSSWKARAAAAAFVADIVLSLVSPAFAASAGINFSGQVSTGASAVLYPLAATTVSFTDSAALKLRSANTSHDTVRLQFQAYDGNSNPVAMEVWTGQDLLQPGEATISTVILPLGNASSTRFTVCAIETTLAGSQVGRVCGNYLVNRQILTE